MLYVIAFFVPPLAVALTGTRWLYLVINLALIVIGAFFAVKIAPDLLRMILVDLLGMRGPEAYSFYALFLAIRIPLLVWIPAVIHAWGTISETQRKRSEARIIAHINALTITHEEQ
jgi:uncharacterized membrane protein YqaE (UPF0057 family)